METAFGVRRRGAEWHSPGFLMDVSHLRGKVLADHAVQGTEQHGYYRYFILAKGLAEYRAGHHAEAVTYLERFGPNAEGFHWDATALAALGMAKRRVGEDQQARDALGKAEKILAEKMPAVSEGQMFGAGDWHDWMHAQILCREAQRVLDGDNTVEAGDGAAPEQP